MPIDLIELLRVRSRNRSRNFYNIMPFENIPSVVEHGILSFNQTRHFMHTSIALNSVQERRNSVYIPNGGALHDYANLYFTHHNPMMYKRRTIADEICVLAIHPEVLYLEGCILSDRNAATDLARFYTPEEGLNSIDFSLVFARSWTDNDPYVFANKRAIKCAEILVPECIPYDYIIGAYVVSEEAESKLESLGFDKQIVIKPEVFYR